MAKSFIEAINESNINQGGLVDEMGVKRPERLAGSHIGRARQETVTRRERMANQPVRRSYTEVAADLTLFLLLINQIRAGLRLDCVVVDHLVHHFLFSIIQLRTVLNNSEF